jgi:hypothetical protein
MDMRLVAVPDLARLCQDETAKFLRREPSRDEFCLELLRRAVVDDDQSAWGAILVQ